MWEDARNAHLTPSEMSIHPLLDIIHNFNLCMALPPFIPTLQALSTGNWTRPNNVWCSNHSLELFMKCDTNLGLQGPNIDHVPILSSLDIPLPCNTPKPTCNFCVTDWSKLGKQLTHLLDACPRARRLRTPEELHPALDVINKLIRDSIDTLVPMTKPLPHTKRWWSQELNIMRKKKNQLANTLFCWRGTSDYPSHLLHKKSLKDYVKLIETTKKEHWENELLNTSEKDIWMANKYTTDAPTDGSKTRMTTLNFVDKEGDTHHTTSNAEKSTALAKSLFPPPPMHPSTPHTCYP